MFQDMFLPYRKLYALVAGRSSRGEFWWFVLFNVVVSFLAVALLMSVVGGLAALGQDASNPAGMMEGGGFAAAMAGLGIGAIGFMLVFYVWALATSVASLAVTVRRLHDLGYSGWLLLAYYVVLIVSAFISMWLYLLVVIGFIVVMALPGTSGANKYGSDPLQPETGAGVFA